MKNIFRLIVAFLLTFGTGAIGTFFTISQIPAWYDSLIKPSFNPPSWVFGPVWSILYVLIALALVLVWNTPESEARRRWFFIFGVQLLLNMLWSILFFGTHGIFLAGVDIVLLWIFVVMLALDSWELDRIAFWLLIPYVAWVTFAGILNVSIWWMN